MLFVLGMEAKVNKRREMIKSRCLGAIQELTARKKGEVGLMWKEIEDGW